MNRYLKFSYAWIECVLNWNVIVYDAQIANLLSSRDPLSCTRIILMAKHESESTYICNDNTWISEKTFFVPLGFGGYLLIVEIRWPRDGIRLFLLSLLIFFCLFLIFLFCFWFLFFKYFLLRFCFSFHCCFCFVLFVFASLGFFFIYLFGFFWGGGRGWVP